MVVEPDRGRRRTTPVRSAAGGPAGERTCGGTTGPGHEPRPCATRAPSIARGFVRGSPTDSPRWRLPVRRGDPASLNDQQRDAVTHGDGPLLIVAGAGTGKTEVITRRIAWLIATQARAARGDPRPHVHRQGRRPRWSRASTCSCPTAASARRSSTFHAFCDRLVRERAIELGLTSQRSRRARAPRSWCSCASALFELRASRATCRSAIPIATCGALARAVRPRARRGRRRPSVPRVRRAAGARTPASDPERPDRCRAPRPRRRAAYAALPAAAAASTAASTSATQPRAAAAARAAAPARAQLRDRYRCDPGGRVPGYEPRAVRAGQAARGGERGATSPVVGDDDQSIYRFRGAKVDNLAGVPRRLPGRARDRCSTATTAPGSACSTRPPADPPQRSRRGSRRCARLRQAPDRGDRGTRRLLERPRLRHRQRRSR